MRKTSSIALLIVVALAAGACADSGGTDDGSVPTLPAVTTPADGAAAPDDAAATLAPGDASMPPGDGTDGGEATLPAETLLPDEDASE